jgi:hypothetical protein
MRAQNVNGSKLKKFLFNKMDAENSDKKRSKVRTTFDPEEN